jgi:membrane-associated phospholipid phosphatase
LGVAALCLLGLALTWAAVAHLPAVQFKDAAALHDFTLLDGPRLSRLAESLLHLLDPALYLLWSVLIIAVALVRGRHRMALAVGLVLVLAPLTAEVLKPLLAYPHAHVGYAYVGPGSWPSGHAAAALSLGLCAVLVAPVRLRGWVAGLGALFVGAVGCALLIRAWHMPSDVLGGYLVAGLWTALAFAALRVWDARDRAKRAYPSAAPPPPEPAAAWAPGSHSGSAPRSLQARARMNSRSESRFR